MAPTRSGADFRYSAGQQNHDGSASLESAVVSTGAAGDTTLDEEINQGAQVVSESSELTPLDSLDAASFALPPSEQELSNSDIDGATAESIPVQGVADVLPEHPRASYSSVIADRSNVGDGLDAGSVELSRDSRQKISDHERSDEEGFITPRSVTRSPSRPSKAASPKPQSSRFFPKWFENARKESSKARTISDWADLPDDGLGEIPAEWTHTIKVENDTPQLYTPMNEVISKVMSAADEETRHLLERRLRHVLATPGKGVGSDSSDSGVTTRSGERRRGRSSRQSKPSSRGGKGKAARVDRTSVSRQRISALAKGKGVDPLEQTGIPPSSLTEQATGDSDDEYAARLQQDWELANELQEKLDAEDAAMLSLREDYLQRERQKMQESARLQREVDAIQKRIRQKARRVKRKSSLPVLEEIVKSNPVIPKVEIGSMPARMQRVSVVQPDPVLPKPIGRFDKASSQLPVSSRLRRAMEGRDHDNGRSSGSELSSGTSLVHEDRKGKKSGHLWSSGDSETSDMFPEAPDSVHSSDSEPTKSRKRKLKRRYNDKMLRLKYQQGFLKVDPPFVYNGEVRADLYKKWVQEVRLFTRLGGLKVKQSLLIMGKYLGGRAYHWYDREIRGTRKSYTLAQFFTGLFDHVFPPDFRAQQRDLFDVCDQRKRTVRDYLQNLRDLANTVGNLTDQDIVLGFWRRSDSYLRIEFTKAGYDAETLTLAMLEDLAVKYERVHILAEKEAQRDRVVNGKSGNSFGSRGNNREMTRQNSNKDWKSKIEYRGGEKSTPGAAATKPNIVPGNTPRPVDKKKDFNSSEVRRVDQEKKNRLRSEGRCFQCESKEHMLKDCPKKQQVRAPAARAVQVDFGEIERLRAVKVANSLGLMAALPVRHTALSEVEVTSAQNEVLVLRALCILNDAVPLPFDNLEGSRSPLDLERFDMYLTTDEEFVLTDHHSGETHLVQRADLMNPSFDFVHWLVVQKANRFDELETVTREVPFHYPDLFEDEWDDLPALQTVSDSDDESEPEMETETSWTDIDMDSESAGQASNLHSERFGSDIENIGAMNLRTAVEAYSEHVSEWWDKLVDVQGPDAPYLACAPDCYESLIY